MSTISHPRPSTVTPRHPESHPEYPALMTLGEHRVIRCRDGIQFILQRSRTRGGSIEWKNLRFCVTRKALERDWRQLTGTDAPKVHP